MAKRSRWNRARSIAGCLGLLVLGSVEARAAGWSQWRGPGRDGEVAGFAAPETWPTQLKQLWKVPVGSGHASPLVDGERIYVHAREGDEEVVRALALADGKELWQARQAAPFAQNQYATAHGKGPNSTPLLADGRLLTQSIHGVLSAFDAATGKLLWRQDFSSKVSSAKLFTGTSLSPLAEGGRVITHLGDDRGGVIVAFDAATGEERWRFEGDGPGYASPIVAELGGVRQLVTLSDRSALALGAADGKLLWQLPFPDEWNENIVTPLVWQGNVIFSGVRRGTLAVRPERGESGFTVKELWSRPEVPMYMSSPVIEGGVLYGFSSKLKGHFFALDLATGRTLWASEGRWGESAALYDVGSWLIALLTDARLLVLEKNPEAFQVAASYTVAGSPTWSQPVLWGKQILIKDAEHLTLWALE